MEDKNGFKTMYSPVSKNRKELLVYMDARQFSLFNKERSEYIDFYHQEKLVGLAFENPIYYKFNELEVLEQYPFIKHLFIGQKNIKNLSGIKYINDLQGLYFFENAAPFNFEIVKHSLKILSFTWHKKLSNLDALKNLSFLHIEKDFESLVLPPNIEDLELWKSKRINLDFLENHLSLREVELFSNRSLRDINGLKYLSNSLEKLQIEKCKNIMDYTPILKLKKLKHLRIDSYDKSMKASLKELQPLLKKQIEEVIIYPLIK